MSEGQSQSCPGAQDTPGQTEIFHIPGALGGHTWAVLPCSELGSALGVHPGVSQPRGSSVPVPATLEQPRLGTALGQSSPGRDTPGKLLLLGETVWRKEQNMQTHKDIGFFCLI